MRTTLIVLTLVLYQNSIAQEISKSQIIGSWTVENVTILIEQTTQEQELLVAGLKQGFTNAVFNFSENGNFEIKYPQNKPEFFDEIFFLENSKWIISETDSMIKIGTALDNYSLLWIQYKFENNQTYFILYEAGILLKMNK